MPKQSRRDFLRTSGSFVGAAALGSVLSHTASAAEAEKKWPGFKHAMCNESMQELPWAEQCGIIAGAGYTAVEIAPFTLVTEGVGEISPEKRKDMLTTIQSSGLTCAGLHWLLAPPPKGLHFTTPDEAVRKESVAYLDALIDFCGDLEGEVMIFGSPNQRNTKDISIEEAKKYFADGLAAVADHAQARSVQILIESLDTSQTDVVNTLAEAMEIVAKVDHPAIQTMFDFHNTPNETEPFHALIDKNYSHIGHVHVQEMDGKHLGTGNAVNDYVQGFQTLKDHGYNRWVSLEVFDFSPGGEVIAEESMGILKQIEGKLA